MGTLTLKMDITNFQFAHTNTHMHMHTATKINSPSLPYSHPPTASESSE